MTTFTNNKATFLPSEAPTAPLVNYDPFSAFKQKASIDIYPFTGTGSGGYASGQPMDEDSEQESRFNFVRVGEAATADISKKSPRTRSTISRVHDCS